MKSIFLIKTPLQLLNAIEARHYFNLDMDDCLLIIMGDRKSQPQILGLVNNIDEWRNVIVLNDVNLFSGNPLVSENKIHHVNGNLKSKILSKSFFNVRRLNRISKYLGKVDNIFIGHAGYIYMKHFMNVTLHNKLVLLDDGTATIQMAKERKYGISVNKNNGILKKIKLYFKKTVQGVRDKDKKSLCFFTMYDVSPGEHDHVVKNNFNHFRSVIDLLPVSDDIYFLGSPISETGIISLDDYLMHIKKVKKYFGNKNLIYIAHRRETSENLNKIKKDLGLNVVLFDYPIEYQLAVVGPRPKVLASFISSALDSCRLIFNDKLKIISFRLDLTESPKREVVEQVYESYKPHTNKNFSVISNY